MEPEPNGMRKPTFMALWHMHYDVLSNLFEVAGLHPLAVAAVVVGCDVPFEVFDATLKALNTLAGTHYTREDIAGVHLVPQQQMVLEDDVKETWKL